MQRERAAEEKSTGTCGSRSRRCERRAHRSSLPTGWSMVAPARDDAIVHRARAPAAPPAASSSVARRLANSIGGTRGASQPAKPGARPSSADYRGGRVLRSGRPESKPGSCFCRSCATKTCRRAPSGSRCGPSSRRPSAGRSRPRGRVLAYSVDADRSTPCRPTSRIRRRRAALCGALDDCTGEGSARARRTFSPRRGLRLRASGMSSAEDARASPRSISPASAS